MLVMRFHSGANGLRYAGNHVAFSKYADLTDFANEIANRCINGETPQIKEGCALRKYNGQQLENRFSEIDSNAALVSASWNTFLEAIRDASREGNPLAQPPNAVVLTSTERDFSLISIQHPVLNFTQKRIFFGKRKFHRMAEDEEILSVSPHIDIVAMNGEIVFLSERGTSFFITDSSIIQVAAQKAKNVASYTWISDAESIMQVAKVPRYAKWLLAVDDERLAKLDKPAIRKKVADTFEIQYEHGRFITSERADAAALIKILGKRGMFDVVEEVPMEVAGVDPWKKE